MRVIYVPKGPAREYGPLAVALYRNCGHGCKACYVPRALHTTEEKFHSPYPRENILALLERDLDEMEKNWDQREVLMSFSTDPYQPLDEKEGLTRRAIQMMIDRDIHFTTLTHAGFPATRDLDLMASRTDLCRFGVSLTLWKEEDRKIWEPGSPPAMDRIKALMYAYSRGIRTWVSLEPVIYPDQSLELIRLSHLFVCLYRIGKINHVTKKLLEQIPEYALPNKVQWENFCEDAKDLLEHLGKKYVFKDSMLPYLKRVGGECPKCGGKTFTGDVDDQTQDFCINEDCRWKGSASQPLKRM